MNIFIFYIHKYYGWILLGISIAVTILPRLLFSGGAQQISLIGYRIVITIAILAAVLLSCAVRLQYENYSMPFPQKKTVFRRFLFRIREIFIWRANENVNLKNFLWTAIFWVGWVGGIYGYKSAERAFPFDKLILSFWRGSFGSHPFFDAGIFCFIVMALFIGFRLSGPMLSYFMTAVIKRGYKTRNGS